MLIRSLTFWIVVLVISFIGMIAALVAHHNREMKLQNSDLVYVMEFRSGSNAITAYIEKKHAWDRVHSERIKSEYLNTPFRRIYSRQEAYLLEYSNDSSIVKLGFRNLKMSKSAYNYIELWIDSRFVQHSPNGN